MKGFINLVQLDVQLDLPADRLDDNARQLRLQLDHLVDWILQSRAASHLLPTAMEALLEEFEHRRWSIECADSPLLPTQLKPAGEETRAVDYGEYLFFVTRIPDRGFSVILISSQHTGTIVSLLMSTEIRSAFNS
jgi:hypothetical protein